MNESDRVLLAIERFRRTDRAYAEAIQARHRAENELSVAQDVERHALGEVNQARKELEAAIRGERP